MNLGQLQILTSYSLLKSTNEIPKLVLKAKEFGYTSLAITDINTMHGTIEFYKACLKEKIKPIIGMTLTYSSKSVENHVFQLVLLAQNNIGYQNLITISTNRMEKEEKELFYLSEIMGLTDGLIAISPWESESSELSFLLKENQPLFSERIKENHTLFPENSFYQGVVLGNQTKDVLTDTLKAFKDEGVPIVALQDVRYLLPEDHFSVEVLKHIDVGEQISLEKESITGPYFLPDKNVFEASFLENNLVEAIENNQKITSMCQVEIKLHQKLLPKFPIEEVISSKEYLKKLCLNGLAAKGLVENKRYIERLRMELDVINEMGFNDYFLIVWDVMSYSRKHNIVTTCRGSAAGSLVSYALSITNVDPIEYGLLFERFLNKERYTMPDIDMDIPDNRREELLIYVHQKYGYHKVAQIATFGTLAAKMALRDVSRVFGLKQSEANNWVNTIPNVLKITLGEAYNQSNKLRDLVASSEKNRLLFETAKKIEGLPRHISTHAAGVVISDQELTNFLPLQKGSNDIPLTQLTMGGVEEIGLLKMDFLGLKNLSIIGNTLESIKYSRNEVIDLNTIPLDDEKTLNLFKMGETVGIFQFESEGIKKVLRKLGPTSIEDIASVNALYRPGPMQNIDLFVARKKGLEPISYPHEKLKQILDYTYGVIVYQEQIMQIASLMAGFSLGQADILRRAISKKKKEVLDTERQHFVSGSLKQGYTEEVAQEVYQYIERFANYGFNRSHAVVYAVLAYQMAYLKVHYPENFFSALLHSVKNNPSKTNEYLIEAKKSQLKFLPPDINKSEASFKIYKGKIIFGLSSIKGVRKDFIKEILLTRKKEGRFTSLENFLIRIDPKWLKESNLLPLIMVGVFDSLHSNRKQLLTDLGSTINNIAYSGGNVDLLAVLSLKKEEMTDFTLDEKLDQESEYLGTYVSAHPVDAFEKLRKGRQIINLAEAELGQTGHFLIYVLTVKKIRTKKGESMAILTVNDGSKEMEVIVFPKLFRQLNLMIHENEVYLLEGKATKSNYNQMTQLLAENLNLAKEVKEFDLEKKCYLRIFEHQNNPQILNQIKSKLLTFKGDKPIILVFDSKKILLEETFWVEESQEFIDSMTQILGVGMVAFQ